MDAHEIVRRRLAAQHLDARPADTPAAVVRDLLAVQAQDFEPACWSVAMRTGGETTAQDVLAAFDAGAFLRTHVLRPTWHFVHRDDLRWLLALTAPRVHVANGHRYRALALDPTTLQQATDVIVDALEGRALTRRDLGEALRSAGIEAEGQRLAYIVMHAELEQVVCSGPRRGKQQTYALLDERVAPGRARERNAALGALAVRFFTGHGPGTVHDLKGWASLTVAEARAAVEAAGERLDAVEVDGRELHDRHGRPPATPTGPRVHLLQPYDEYISGFPKTRDLVDVTGQAGGGNRLLLGDVLVDGRLRGTWRRVLGRDEVGIELALPEALGPGLDAALEDAVQRYAAFQARPARVTYRQRTPR